MPLTKFVERERATIVSFLEDGDAVAFELRATPERQAISVRLLADVAEKEEHLFVAVDGPFKDEGDLCSQIEQALLEGAENARAALAEETVKLDLLKQMPTSDEACCASPAVRLVALGEQIARELYPFFAGVVVVLRPELPGDEDVRPFMLCFARLVAAAESGLFKLILVNGSSSTLITTTPMPRRRLAPYVVPAGKQPRKRLLEMLSDPTCRVLLYDAPRKGQEWLAAELSFLFKASKRFRFVHAEGVRFWRALHFYGRAAEAVVSKCHALAVRKEQGDLLAPFLDRIKDPQGRYEAEAYFLKLLEDVTRAWLPPGCSLVVLITPSLDEPDVREGELEQLKASMLRLSRAAVLPNVKIVVAGPGLAAPGPVRENAVQSHEVILDGPAIATGIEERLQVPDLPLIERLRLTEAMSSFAIVRGNPEQALKLGIEAVDLAGQTGDPQETAVAQYSLGNILYRCRALDQALVSYSTALDIAVDHNSAILAAQAVTGIANCHFIADRHAEAVRCYGIARTYFAKQGQPVHEAYVLMWTAESLAAAKNLKDAEARFRDALACCDRAGEGTESLRSEIMQRLARVLKKQGQSAKGKHLKAEAQQYGPLTHLVEEP
jgi:tetratricopeptide (TPR) repeat protein